MIILQSDRLRVQIAEPDDPVAVTPRFDRAGFITQVTLDGRFDFCAAEPEGPNATRGRGLCCEQRFVEDLSEALSTGEKFPKLGLGLLTKDEDIPYTFFHEYPCERFDISHTADGHSAVFTTQPRECLGVAARTVKRVSVAGNRLTVEETIGNVGEKPLFFGEFCHNFVTLEGLPLGPGYRLDMPVKPQDGKKLTTGDTLTGRGSGFTFAAPSAESNFVVVEEDEIGREAPFAWKLTHADSSAWISESVSDRPFVVKVWAFDRIISPEVTMRFRVLPGESRSWKREWTFGC